MKLLPYLTQCLIQYLTNMSVTSTQLKAQIDVEITSKTQNDSITPNNVGGKMKDIVDYIDQEVGGISLTPGPQGPAGQNGVNGQDGVDGIDGQNGVPSGFLYKASTGISTGGFFNLQIDTEDNSGSITISENTLNGISIGSFLNSWGNSTNNSKGYIIIQSLDFEQICILEITDSAVVDASPSFGTTFIIPVNLISSDVITSNTECSLSYTRTGDKGQTGAVPSKTRGTKIGGTSSDPTLLDYDINLIFEQSVSENYFKLPNVTVPGVEIIVNGANTAACFIQGFLNNNSYLETGVTSSVSQITVFNNEVYKFISSGNNYWFVEYVQRNKTKINNKDIDNKVNYFTTLVDNTIVSALTTAQLNSTYGAEQYTMKGFQLVCPSIETIYVRLGASSWGSYPITLIS